MLVVGAGPAGLAAALAASEAGKRVILADEQAEMGGALLHELTSTIDGKSAWAWLEDTLARLASRGTVTLLPRTTAFGYYNHNHVGLVQRVTDHLADPHPDLPRERLWQVRAREVVLATGAHERPLVFAGNDRPGIMLAESLRVFVNRYGVVPGQRALIVTSGASAYTAAADLKAAGIDVAVVDVRPHNDCAVEAAALRAAGCEVLAGHTVLGSRGRGRVSGLIVAPIGDFGKGRGPSNSAMRLRRPLRRMDAGGPPVLAVARQARLRCRDRCLRTGRLRAGRAVRRRCPRDVSAHRVSSRRLERRCGRGGTGKRAQVHRERVQDRLPAVPPAADRRREGARSRLRRLAERRDGQGHRARRTRRLRVRSST